jgi:hypothetical protein
MKFIFSLLFAIPVLLPAQKTKKNRDYYQITIYHFSNDTMHGQLDEYLQNSLLPALHRAGVPHIGVFTPISNDTASDKTLYTIAQFKKWDNLLTIKGKLSSDDAYTSGSRTYIDAVYNQPPFTRKEIILLEAFPMATELQVPQLKSSYNDKIYELRSYESATEKLHQNKVQMFNEGGEITLFDRLQFNAVFYASIIAGNHMPNLMYMTSFENMAERDAHWKAFGADPVWKQLSAMPEYQHNVSHIDITFLKATAYSDF